MSGTSLDGLDIAYCTFWKKGNSWNYRIIQAETIPYTEHWRNRLSNVERGSAFEFVATDIEYGHLLGRLTREFMDRYQIRPDFIASHGHTVFHQPEVKLTAQIGRGSAIAAETGCPVVCDFRSLDVALGGQGAPLVPMGDRSLFADYEYCLNLGGFANVSFEKDGNRSAFDICPVNIVLNAIAVKLGEHYDRDGLFARQGTILPGLLKALNTLSFYSQPPPKSLGKEWVNAHIWPLMNDFVPGVDFNNSLTLSSLSSLTSTIPANKLYDLLATWCEHAAYQISRAISGRLPELTQGTGNLTLSTSTPAPLLLKEKGTGDEVINTGMKLADKSSGKLIVDRIPVNKLLVTGGGAFNGYLVERIRHHTGWEIIIPDKDTINYKEALIFGFLGVLRWRNEVNCLRSVTGAVSDNSGGSVYFPPCS
jgi:anhydro-N-acetylmuramic acid kinase